MLSMDDRRLAAIMFTDIVGYTSLMADDEQTALGIVTKQRSILQPIIEQHKGQWLKEMGDGTLTSFASATNAVQCAIDIQNELKQEPQFKIRVGIHLGDVVFTESDVFGDGVNIAARIEPNAEPGGIAISGSVFDTLSNNKRFQTVSLGEKILKNVGRPLRIYAISNDDLPTGIKAATDEVSSKIEELNTALSSKARTKNKPLLIAAVIAAVVGVAFFRFIVTPDDKAIPLSQVTPVENEQLDIPVAVQVSSQDPVDAEGSLESNSETSTEPNLPEQDDEPSDEGVTVELADGNHLDREGAIVVSSEPAFVSPAQDELLVAEESVPVDIPIPENQLPAEVLESPSILVADASASVVDEPAVAVSNDFDEKSIAILPLTNLSADPENAFFAAGVHEEILGQLAKISDLRVISRRSVLQYEGTTENIEAIADDLGVSAIMEGSVRFAGNRVRITCQLINASNDTPVWSETYERELEDIFAIQADVAIQAAEAMQASLLPDERTRIERAATENTEAYTLYLQSLYRAEQQSFSVSTSEDGWIYRGINDLERAVELDPGFAQAFAQLAYVQSFRGFTRVFEGYNTESEQQAIANANRAIELDPSLSKAYSVLAISAIVNRRWQEFLNYADIILSLPDIETTTYSDLAVGFAVIQQYDQARELINSAISSDPNSASMRWLGMVVALVSRDYDTVLLLAEQYRALGGDENSYYLYQAAASEFLGRSAQADEALGQIQGDLSNQDFGFYPYYAYLNCKRGKQAAMQLFAAQQSIFNLTLANIGCRMALSDLDGIYQIIQTLMISGIAFPDLGEIFDELRTDKRFSTIEDYMALPSI